MVDTRNASSSADAAQEAAPPDDMMAALHQRTRSLHLQAEKTGILAAILRGAATREGLLILLRNLHPAYQALERGLEQHYRGPVLGTLSCYRFDRAGAIARDLAGLSGHQWATSLPLLPEGERYAQRLAQVADGDGSLLIAHAYTRYLGDLSGGQILRQVLAKTLNLRLEQLSMFEFPGGLAAQELKREYRDALGRAAASAADPAAIIEECALAFSHNIALSVAVRNHVEQH